MPFRPLEEWKPAVTLQWHLWEKMQRPAPPHLFQASERLSEVGLQRGGGLLQHGDGQVGRVSQTEIEGVIAHLAMGAPDRVGQTLDLAMSGEATVLTDKAEGSVGRQPGQPGRTLRLKGPQALLRIDHHVASLLGKLNQRKNVPRLGRRRGSWSRWGRGQRLPGEQGALASGDRRGDGLLQEHRESGDLLLQSGELSLQAAQRLWQGEQVSAQPWPRLGSRWVIGLIEQAAMMGASQLEELLAAQSLICQRTPMACTTR